MIDYTSIPLLPNPTQLSTLRLLTNGGLNKWGLEIFLKSNKKGEWVGGVS